MGKHGGIMEYVFLGSMWFCKGRFLCAGNCRFRRTHVIQQDSILGNSEQSRVFKDDAGK